MSLRATLNTLQTFDPLQSFIFADLDATGSTIYIGSVAFNSCWMIQAFDTLTNEMRLTMGTTEYATNWGNRASLTYSLPGVD